jgi:hypothetical protein
MNKRSAKAEAESDDAKNASPDAPAVSPLSPYERFERFAKKIITVPKQEIEERERLYQEKKKK